MPDKPNILYVAHSNWKFLLERLPLVLAAAEAGAEVRIAVSDKGMGTLIENFGINCVRLPHKSGKIGGIIRLPALNNMYKEIKPDLVHHFTPEPRLSVPLLAGRFKDVAVVSEMTAPVVTKALKKTAIRLSGMSRSRAIFHTADSLHNFTEPGWLNPGNTKLIRGTGVDSSFFKPGHVKPDWEKPVVLFAGDMLWSNGIRHFIDAARIVKPDFPNARFVLVGVTEDPSPDYVPLDQLESWKHEGIIEWWGAVSNELQVLQEAAMITLPAEKTEGIPASLVKGAAVGRPLITSDIPGCNDVVRDAVNGHLVPPLYSQALAEAILDLLGNPASADAYGQAGRDIAVNEFSRDTVIEETLSIYKDLLGTRWPAPRESAEVRG